MMGNIRRAVICSLGLTALIGSVGAIAQVPMRSSEVLVEASRSASEIEQRAVPYHDLNLGSLQAQLKLMKRVSLAVDSLCVGGDMGVTDPINALKCNRVAWDSLRPQLNNLLTH